VHDPAFAFFAGVLGGDHAELVAEYPEKALVGVLVRQLVRYAIHAQRQAHIDLPRHARASTREVRTATA